MGIVERLRRVKKSGRPPYTKWPQPVFQPHEAQALADLVEAANERRKCRAIVTGLRQRFGRVQPDIQRELDEAEHQEDKALAALEDSDV